MKPALIYDGNCPFCANYVGFLRLRDRWPDVELVDARVNPDHPAVKMVRARGLSLDDGMAMVENDNIHYGADAVKLLSNVPRWAYPILKSGRNLTLRLLGRKKLGF